MMSSGTESRFVVRVDPVASSTGVGRLLRSLLQFPAWRVGSLQPCGFTYRTPRARAQRF